MHRDIIKKSADSDTNAMLSIINGQAYGVANAAMYLLKKYLLIP